MGTAVHEGSGMDGLKNEMERCFKTLHGLIDESFVMMDNRKELRDGIAELWKDYVVGFVKHTTKTGEKFNNKEMMKKITRALMFHR